MIKYVVAALCMIAVAEAAIAPFASVSRRINPLAVEGIVPCGSAGQIFEVRVPECTRVPCALYTEEVYPVEIDFSPSASHPGLNLKVTLIHEGEHHHIIDGAVPGSAVEAGGRYTLTYPVTVEGFIMGLSDLRIEVSGQVNTVIELCGIAGIHVHPPRP